MIHFMAHIRQDGPDTWSVDFPDLPGCFSAGDSLDDAKLNAAEALTVYLESLDSRSQTIPDPRQGDARDMYPIEPSLNVAFAVTLKKERERQRLTQKEVARRMGIAWSAYQRIENPRKANPTLSTIAKLQHVFGKNLLG